MRQVDDGFPDDNEFPTQELGGFITGWWFQTFFIVDNIWNNPSH